ncbi:hypothetical protein CC80DRAFT_584790 [Byssothecium circinans]|uniref:Fibronectin type-III domain-containing protein n=1 Tax=Byssothecium circinans TaxID=147558 RepID=A0A6A5UAT5_9PLEO|nr:hypothetical protein CC80DRAFT_584790 [Byssothecium circinans]
MPSTRLIHFFLSPVLYSFGFFVDAASTASATTGNSSQAQAVSTSAPSNATIGFASAVQIEASVALELQRLASVPAIPLPTNITQYPQYEAVRQLAPAMPLVQGDTLLLGDSITHGQQGDYTWRYRIWQWFQSSGISFQIVGPYKGTKAPPPAAAPQPPPLYGSPADTSFSIDGGYAVGVDPGFLSNSNHFAVWGRAAAVDKELIRGVLQQNPADLILLMLGFNDLGWFYSDVSGTLASIQTLITNARSVNPSLKFAVANIPHRTHIGGRDDLVQNTDIYNSQLSGLLSTMSTAPSPIHVVDIPRNYACQDSGCPAGYDGLHPNAWGEYQIASAFSKTLVNDFKIGSSPLTVPDQSDASLVRDLPVPSNIKAFSSPQGVTVTWDAGKFIYDVQATVNGVSASFSPGTVDTNRWDSQWPLEGWVYTVSVRAAAGDRKSAYTSSVSAVATPELPPPPRNINVQPSGNGVTVIWDPPTGGSTGSIVEYNVIYWDWKWDHCQFISGAAFKTSPAVIDDFIPSRNYAIFLVTWDQNGQGLPAGSFSVVPGAGTPPIPSGLQVHTNDPTTVHLTWSGLDSAGGYRVWYRNVNLQGSQLELIENVTMTSSISSFNGNENSDKGPEVIAPSPASTVTIGSPGPTCPPEPSWCPGGGEQSGQYAVEKIVGLN